MNAHLSAFTPIPTPYPCYCLALNPDAPKGHTPTCPFLQPVPPPPLDLSLKIIDPTRFTVRAPPTPSTHTHHDPFARLALAQLKTDPGFRRIDTFTAALNFIRTTVPGCTIFYSVTDTLLRHFFAQLLPVIVGDQRYLLDPGKYHHYAQVPHVPVRSFTTTARQIGKTTTMAIALAALLCVADGMDLAKIYARTQNQAVNLLSEVKNIFHHLPATLKPTTVLKMNETTISILSPQNNLPITIQAAPGNIEGIRGHKPRVIVVDEYQFTLPDFWTQHIWALCQVVNRVLICASTPGEPGSYMAAETMRMKTQPEHYGESTVLDFSLVCPKHRQDDTPMQCRCRLDLLPPWKNVAAIRMAQSQYGDGKKGDFIQEVLGEPVSTGTRIFDPKLLASTFHAPPLPFHGQSQGNVLYVNIDPSGGGDSELAVASLLYTMDSRLLLVGLESTLTKKMGANDVSQFIRQHLRLLRKHFRNSVLVPIVEDQGGVPMAQTICDIFREQEFLPAIFLVGHRVDALCRSDGVPTTRPIKENMVFLCESLLKDDRIKIHPLLLTTGTRTLNTPANNTPADLLNLLHAQLGALFYDEKKHITGKLGPGFKDDLAMAFLLGIYWSNKLRTGNRSLVNGQVVFDPFHAL